jgi:hypothetical protein
MDELEPTIAVDFDKTICDESSLYPEFGKLIEGTNESLQKLKDMGYSIKIYTCRLNGQAMSKGSFISQYNALIDWLQENEVPYDDIATPDEGKIFAEFYIDDKGIRFQDNWEEVVSFIEKNGNVEKNKKDRILWHDLLRESYEDKKLSQVLDKEIFLEIKKIKDK